MTDSEDVRGGAFYDDPALLDAYLAHRHSPVTSPNLVMEDPAFRELAGRLDGLSILDLGCGDGTLARVCVDAGGERYVGVDGSQLMISRAKEGISAPRVDFHLADLEDYMPEPESVDLVVSRMALHYVKDLGPVLANAHRALKRRGRLVFSVVHPVLTSAYEAPTGHRTSQVVDNYFRAGDRHREWFGKPVLWRHRSIEDYVRAVIDAGFRLDDLRECAPVQSLFDGDTAEYERRLRVPVFLLISASRLPGSNQ